MKTLNLSTVFVIILFTCSIAKAQEEQPSPLIISGSVDTYFRTTLDSKSRIDANEVPGTSFANIEGFALGMANLVLSKESDKVGFVADLVFGPRGAEAVFNSPASLNIINQLYVYWKVSGKTTLSLGNFNTFLGYEVISPAANFNYSTSYMFSYGPFSHSGLKADFIFNDDLSAMVGVFNPTDWTDGNPFGTYTIGAQLGFKGVYFNFLYGDQDGKLDEDLNALGDVSLGNTFQADITAGFDVTPSFYAGVNATYNTTDPGETLDEDVGGDGAGFYGAAGYLQLSLSERFAVGTRIEYFKVYNGALDVFGLDPEGDGSVIDVTLSAQYKVGDLTIIPEFRIDNTSEDTFMKPDQTGLDKNLSSFLVAAVYTF